MRNVHFHPTYLWSEATYQQTQETRLEIVEQLITERRSQQG